MWCKMFSDDDGCTTAEQILGQTIAAPPPLPPRGPKWLTEQELRNTPRLATVFPGPGVPSATLDPACPGARALPAWAPAGAPLHHQLPPLVPPLCPRDLHGFLRRGRLPPFAGSPGGLATGGGIGVLAAVENVEPGAVNLIAPEGTVDAGDAGIRATGDIKIAAAAVVNADNIAAGGSSTGVPTSASVAAPNIGGLTSGATSSAATSSAASQVTQQAAPQEKAEEETPSLITVEVLGYGGGDNSSDEEDEETAAEG